MTCFCERDTQGIRYALTVGRTRSPNLFHLSSLQMQAKRKLDRAGQVHVPYIWVLAGTSSLLLVLGINSLTPDIIRLEV